MNRAGVVELRKALQQATVMMHAGLDFVCVPVISPEDKQKLLAIAGNRLDKIEKACERAEKERGK